jgi:hypothetical protein
VVVRRHQRIKREQLRTVRRHQWIYLMWWGWHGSQWWWRAEHKHKSLVAVMVLISLTPVDLPHASNGIEMTNVRMERDF